jgi:hypothetical protein
MANAMMAFLSAKEKAAARDGRRPGEIRETCGQRAQLTR